MVYRKNTLIKFAALLLTAGVVTPAANQLWVRGAAVAQSFGDTPESFPIPSSLPDGSALSVDGSTSMQVTNQDLESRYEAQYPNIDITLEASRTDEAIAALLDGDIDLVAAGRPLTDTEKAEGLVEVPLEREKIAFIVGPDNEFEGELTFAQFARIFRGEITNWSEVGGPDRPIRVVDRPDFSDTRRALSTYEVFQGQPFATGATADPIADDQTPTLIEALGNDGIGYAVYSQVQGLDTVRILPMHQTLPDDPRYPYSQYRAFVYRESANPAALAFLGFAMAEPGAEVMTDAVAEAAPPAEDTAAIAEPTEAVEAETALVPDPEPVGETGGGFPWWLLGIPILGGLLWWLFKNMGGSAPPVAVPVAAPDPRLVLTPRNCRDAYAYWEIPSDRWAAAKREGGDPLKLRLYDVTGRPKGAALPPHTAEFDCVGDEPDLHLPIGVDNHDYLAEVGYLTPEHRWVPLAKSEPVRVPACPEAKPARPGGTGAKFAGVPAAGLAAGAAGLAGAAALAGKAKAQSARLILTPRNCRDAYAYWEVPTSRLAELQRPQLIVRLYDVTGRARDAALPDAIAQFACANGEPDLHLPIERDDRDYRAELGYLTQDKRWLPIVKSDPVHVPACPPSEAGRGLPGAAVGAAAGAAALGAATLAKPDLKSRMVLTPRTSSDAYAYWEVPESRWQALQQQGGQRRVVRLYDVTNRLPNAPLPTAASQFACVGDEPDLHLPIKQSDRDYVAEVGYLTAADRWLPAAKSAPVRVPAATIGGTATGRFPGQVVAGAAAVGATAVGAAAVGAGQRLKATVAPDLDANRIVLTPRNPKKAYAYWELSDKAKNRARAEGGKDYQLRLYDVTDINLEQQPPHSVLTYDVREADSDRFVPLPATNRDYIAEIGYRAEDGTWLDLARSQPVRADVVLNQPSTLGLATGVGAVAAAAVAAPALAAATTSKCAIQTVTVHSRHNAVQLDASQMALIQETVAVKQALEKGLYLLNIREGAFSYDGDEAHPGEPFVLLWIYGGSVVNQKTGVPVNATWSTLNGYADTLTLDVREPAQVCAFFMDTFPDDNRGEVTLAVIKL